MTNTTQTFERTQRLGGAARLAGMYRPSTLWSIATVAISPKPCTHVVTKDFGANATSHHRPLEAPL